MGKMILVIDEVYSCMDCPLTLASNICYGCHLTVSDVLNGTSDFIEGTRRHISCPLRPLPKKMILDEEEQYQRQYDTFDAGWNECIDEILGETE